MQRIRLVALIFGIVLAVVAATAASASASEKFIAAKYPVNIKSKALNFQGFEITGAVSVCKKATFNTGEEGAENPSGPSETLEVHPIYTECEATLAGSFKAKVITTGCNYLFHAATPKTKNGSVDVVCQAGKVIEVVVEGLTGCVITVGSQKGLKTVEYINEAGKVAVNAEVTGIEYKAASACGLAQLEGKVGKYREGEFTAGVAKLAPEGKPSKAVSEGFNELAEPDFVAVSAAAAGNGSAVHWQGEGTKVKVSEKQGTIAWGTLELISAAGTIKCKNAVAGNNINQPSGEAHSEVVMFSTFECTAAGGECVAPAEERATAFNLTPDASPNLGVWPAVNFEEGPPEAEETFRSESENVKVNIECYAAGEKIGSLLFVTGGPNAFGKTGSSTPAWLNGSSASKPSEVSFDAKSGHLQAEGETESPKETEAGTVEYKLGSKIIKAVSPATWGAKVKAGCRIKSEAAFPNDTVKTVINATEIEMGNPVNGEGKSIGLKTGTFGTEFKCGPIIKVPIEGTTKGKVKVVGYKDNAPVPLVTLGVNAAP